MDGMIGRSDDSTCSVPAPRAQRKVWQTPTVITGEDQSLASAEVGIFAFDDGDPGVNQNPS